MRPPPSAPATAPAGCSLPKPSPPGLAYGHQLWFGTPRNIGRRLAEIADELKITVHVAEPA
jgi:hypothetical protein